eukprot:TRINITY_DN1024_c0_g1_i1.p1 TRINITY_DN1024_c0_g1~~TRINITY_DN1024_c0_g1_i1.p1  ORF type:complete len:319 (+),score=89.72 TRINITY_DN1024_c0_g1_i1:191-1147(+)
MAAAAVRFAIALSQFRFADFARVQVNKHLSRRVPTLQTILDEEALVKSDEPLDPVQFDDHVRLLMRVHSQTPEWDAEVLFESMVHIIEQQRSSPEKRTLTCDQATAFVFLETKWRLDSESATTVASLLNCAGTASADSTCTVLPKLAAKCPAQSAEDLLALRQEIFEAYVPAHAAGSEVASEGAHSQDDEEEEAVEDVDDKEEQQAVEDDGDVASEASVEEQVEEEPEEQEAPKEQPAMYYEACKAGRKVHEVHTDKAHKCAKPKQALSCPGSSSAGLYCYDEDRHARCCCRESDLNIKNKIGGQRVKKGTAKCASIY